MAFDVVREAEQWPEGVMTADLERVAKSDISYDLEDAKAEGALISLAGLWLTPDTWQFCAARFLSALDALHGKDKKLAGWPPVEVCREAKLGWAAKPAQRAAARLEWLREVRTFHGLVARVRFRPEMSEKQEAILKRVVDELSKHGLDTPEAKDIALATGLPRHAVEEAMKLGHAAGDLGWVGQMPVPTSLVVKVLEQTHAFFGDRSFGVGEWRDAMETSRRVAVEWLEHFDRVGDTVKNGDFRRLNE